jgi:hypothetical protein
VNYEYVVIMPCLFFVFHMSLLQTWSLQLSNAE